MIESDCGMDRNSVFVVKDCYMEFINAVTKSGTVHWYFPAQYRCSIERKNCIFNIGFFI